VVTSVQPSWKAGTTVQFIIEGNLRAPIVAGSTIKSVAKFYGSEVANELDDLCTYDGTPFQCTEEPGAKKWTFNFPIPTVPLSGKLTSNSVFSNADGSLIMCLDLGVVL